MPAIIGLFAFAQGLELCLGEAHATIAGTKRLSWNIWPKFSEIWHIRWSLSRGWACGLVLGIIPAAGASVAQWIAYAWEIRRGKPGDGFGKGEIKGLAATEGSTGTSLIPMFVLGIPGGISAAVILGALVVHGLQPGMRLFETNPDVVYTVIWGFILANIMMGVIAVFLARAMAYLTVFPSGILAPMILIFCVIGTYTNTNNLFDVWLMIGFGVLGYFMYKYRFSPAGLLLGLILGPIAENGLRDLMVVSHCNPIAFTLGRPISLATWPRPYWCCSTPSVSAHGEEQRERDVESVTAGTDGKASPLNGRRAWRHGDGRNRDLRTTGAGTAPWALRSLPGRQSTTSASALRPALSMPMTAKRSSFGPLSPLTPTAPMISPSSERMRTPPGLGNRRPLDATASAATKLGLSLAFLARERLDSPIAIAPQALPIAMSGRNMLAPSSR